MKIFKSLNNPQVSSLLKTGAVGIVPTDTIYGIVASVWMEAAVKRLYQIRQRDQDKACIVLIANLDQIVDKHAWTEADHCLTKRYWPGKVTIVLPTGQDTWPYLPRFDKTLAYRLPQYPKLRDLLETVGPIIAPSANLQARPPATSLKMAIEAFGEAVDFYVDGGDLIAEASTIIKARDGQPEILRQGTTTID